MNIGDFNMTPAEAGTIAAQQQAAKSAGHVLFTERHEFFLDDAGELWKASRSAAFANGRRLGRWEAPAHLAQAFIEQVRAFEVSE
jgi:hypothetical protein